MSANRREGLVWPCTTNYTIARPLFLNLLRSSQGLMFCSHFMVWCSKLTIQNRLWISSHGSFVKSRALNQCGRKYIHPHSTFANVYRNSSICYNIYIYTQMYRKSLYKTEDLEKVSTKQMKRIKFGQDLSQLFFVRVLSISFSNFQT